MSFDISQAITVSYPDVVAERNRPENQWGDSTLLNAMQKMGFIERRNFGPTIEVPIDYKRNPGADFLASDLVPIDGSKTDVMAAASYTPAELAVPVTWSERDEMTNPSEVQKIDRAGALLDNGFDSHDDLIEEALLAASATDGFNSFAVLLPSNGQGTVGGIDSGTETVWRNPNGTYLADGSDMESALTAVWNSACKGSGSKQRPKLIFGGSDPQSLFESTQTPMQRFSGDTGSAGFDSIRFKRAPFEFSQYGGDDVYGIGGSFKLLISKTHYRKKGKTIELEQTNGYRFKIYSGLQLVTKAKSRGFRLVLA